MKSSGWTVSISRLLMQAGDRLLFSPRERITPPVKEEKENVAARAALRASRRTMLWKNAAARAFEDSFFKNAVLLAKEFFFSIRCRSFSIFFFVCGLIQALSFFGGSFLGKVSGSEENLFFGLIFIVTALVTMFERASLGAVLKKSAAARLILQDLLGFGEDAIPDRPPREAIATLALLGAATGAFAVLFSPLTVALWALLILALALVFAKPEAGLILTILLIFTLPRAHLCALLGVTLISFFMKAALGKRSAVFSRMDLPVVLGAVWVFFFVNEEGHQSAAILMLLYFAASFLMRTLTWVRRVLTAFSLAVGVALAAFLVRLALARFLPEIWQKFSGLETFFDFFAPESVTPLLALFLPVIIGKSHSAERKSVRFMTFVSALLCLGAAVTEHSPALWLGVLAGLFVYQLLSSRWTLPITVALILLLATALNALPEKTTRQALGFFGFSSDWIRQTSDRYAFPFFWRENAAFLGVPGVILLAAIAVFFVFYCVRFARSVSEAGAFPMVRGVIAFFAGLFFCGAFCRLTPHPVITLVFFFAALPGCVRRAAKREEVPMPY